MVKKTVKNNAKAINAEKYKETNVRTKYIVTLNKSVNSNMKTK